MTFNELVAVPAATQGSITQGWDAVCALNAAQLSSFCFAQYVQNGPTTPASRLRVAVADTDPTYWLLDLTLGPPLISFAQNADPSAGPQCTLSIEVLRGTVLSFNGDTAQILSAVQLQPNQSLLTGLVNLGKVTGQENSVGQVTLDLGSGAYTPQIESIAPGSTLATNVATAIQTYFQSYGATYVLGTLATNSTTPACLQPTDFDFYSQPAPDGNGDGCVLVFIQTNSSGTPTAGPLSPYPIADGYSASLLISNQVIFNQLLPDGALAKQFSTFGTTFNGMQANGIYNTVGYCGSVNLGYINSPGGSSETIYSVTNGNGQPVSNPQQKVVLPMENFILSPGGNALAVNWTQQNTQWWAQVQFGKIVGYVTEDATGTTNWTQQASIAVDSGNNINFSVQPPSVTYTPQSYSWWDEFMGNFDLSGAMQTQITDALQAALNDYQLPSVSTFSLLNLLFPATNLITLTQASLPCDLVANGNINTPLAVTPTQPTATGGATVDFGASGGSGLYSWAVGEGSQGTIDASGLYTAPASVAQVAIDTILVTDSNHSLLNGYALVTLLPPSADNGLLASPSAATLGPGQVLALAALDPTKTPPTPIDATWTMPASAVGTLTQGGMGGAWDYTAPATFTGSAPTTVVLTGTSTSNSQLTCTTTVTLQASESVTVAASATTVALNESVTLAATSADGDLTEFVWLVYPIGQGTVVPTPGNSSQATYTAPASLPTTPTTTLLAYGTGGDSNGLGMVNVTITAAG